MLEFSGVVQKGMQRGTILGYPTINIPLEADDVTGVFVARVVCGGREYAAAAFADPDRHILEAHLLDYAGDLYGEMAHIRLYKKIRDRVIFPTDAALKQAIANDIAEARAYQV